MRRVVIGLSMLLVFSGSVAAQDIDLAAEETTIITGLDAYGQQISVAEGFLINQGDTAYNNISLLAEVYDESGDIIGEGFGYPVKACGEGLLPEFALQPGLAQSFSVPLDIFEEEAVVDRVEIFPQAASIDAQATNQTPSLLNGITQVTNREVVTVEWVDDNVLRYSTGCWRDTFNNRTWHDYNLGTGIQQQVPHPRAAELTPTMLQLINLEDPVQFNRSFFAFAPGQRRAVYQTDLNTLVTVEGDGSFQRVLFDRLYNISLQGINFVRDGIFLAYYHGGYGDDVLYLTASVAGQQLSQHPTISLPSKIIPGVSPNGQRVIIATTVNEVTGYYLRATNTEFQELLFEAEPPGNNWPAPVYNITPEAARYIYVARPVEGEARLQCYNPDSKLLHDLTSLPLQLETDERAWMQLSPNGNTIALLANGLHGGFWLIDLTAFEACA